jgi:hypothetical protein
MPTEPKPDSIPRKRQCFSCRVDAPNVRTLGTLAHYGWRLRVNPQPDGSVRGEYCCPTCWLGLTGSVPLRDRR